MINLKIGDNVCSKRLGALGLGKIIKFLLISTIQNYYETINTWDSEYPNWRKYKIVVVQYEEIIPTCSKEIYLKYYDNNYNNVKTNNKIAYPAEDLELYD